MTYDIAVAGAGASGLVAAIFAAQSGKKVLLVEHNKRAGKKLLSTGNGRCNLTNEFFDKDCYRGSHTELCAQTLKAFDTKQTLEFFESIGISAKSKNGYIYPRSEQASAVAERLVEKCGECRVEILYEAHIAFAGKNDRGVFEISLSDGRKVFSKKLILATGSMAAPKTGSDGSGYGLAKGFGHRIVKPLPALTKLVCHGRIFKNIAGDRCDCRVSIWCGGREVAADTGELQLVENGISGIPVFQVSRYAAELLDAGREVFAALDFFPEYDAGTLLAVLKKRRRELCLAPASSFLKGLLKERLAREILSLTLTKKQMSCGQLDDDMLLGLAGLLKDFRVKILATGGFDAAQVCMGGVELSEVDPDTMESRLCSGLYLAGELMDVDGKCGGYNLQWAFSSGAVAGKNAAKELL